MKEDIQRYFKALIEQAKAEREQWEKLHREWLEQFDKRVERIS